MKCEPGLVSTLKGARPLSLALSAMLYAIGTLLWSMRWRGLLTLMRAPFSGFRVWRLVSEAQAGGILLPGGIGGDALRIASVVREGLSTPIAVGSVLLDRMLGLAALGAVAAPLSFLSPTVPRAFAWISASLPLGFLISLLVLRSSASERLAARLGWLSARVSPLLAFLRAEGAPLAMLRAAVPAVLLGVINLLTLRAIVHALGADSTDEFQFVVMAAFSLVATTVPGVPGGWGTSEAAFAVLLGQAGVPTSVAVSTAFLYRAFWYAWGLLGAILSVRGGNERRDRAGRQ